MFFKKFAFPLFIVLLLSLIVSSLIYTMVLLNSNATWPFWALVILPVLSTIGVIWFGNDRIAKAIDFGKPLLHFFPKKKLLLYVFMPFLVAVLFQPLVNSLRYNFGSVLKIQSIKELKAYENPVFLAVDDWYVDRMQVVPFNFFEKLGGLQMGKVKVNALFLVPIFQKEEAYSSFARAWLGFTYSEICSVDELQNGHAEEFVKSSLIHFKRMDLRQYRYFETYPRGTVEEALMGMSKIHDFYKSGYGNIYKGQDVDRDVLSLHYFQFFLFLFVLAGIPGIFLIAGSLYLMQRYWNEPWE